MSPTARNIAPNALVSTQASSGAIQNTISKSNSVEGGGAGNFAKTQGQIVPGTSSTSVTGGPRVSQGASPFKEALKRGVVSGAGMLTF